MTTIANVSCWAAALGVAAMLASPARAQSSPGSGCTLHPVGGTARHVLQCRGGLKITAEANARYSLIDSNRDGSVDKVRLQDKAILIDAPASPQGFEVITPQAIAAVRGTRWAVDASAAGTAVFVARGAVDVRRRAAGEPVVLGPGQGVDVDAGSAALVVKRWPAKRVAALMARLGQ
ncbi:FecR domain-containing protein [Phyllobacterium sp. 21LDTY02-6]|uniref:FecR domain-containing protein n=1 Tax=unclassified Phyllobacterium TaxID=2638441 RepID=UPI003531E12B